jgi:hypothetical protein
VHSELWFAWDTSDLPNSSKISYEVTKYCCIEGLIHWLTRWPANFLISVKYWCVLNFYWKAYNQFFHCRYDKYFQTPRVWLTGYDEVTICAHKCFLLAWSILVLLFAAKFDMHNLFAIVVRNAVGGWTYVWRYQSRPCTQIGTFMTILFLYLVFWHAIFTSLFWQVSIRDSLVFMRMVCT